MKTKHSTTTAVAVLLLSMSSLHAGLLSEAYQNYSDKNAELEASEYLSLAAGEEVGIAKRGYLPRLRMEAKQLWVGQDIDQEGAGVFRDGYDDFGNSRLKVELDQPLVDLTLKHKVEAAEASEQVVSQTNRIKEAGQIEYFVTTMLTAARFATLERAMDRVIERLEKESITVTENFNEQLATLEDLENVRAAFSAMRQEKRAFEQQVQLRFFELGLDASMADRLVLNANPELKVVHSPDNQTAPKIAALEAQIDAYNSQIKAARLADAPRLSLYGLYEYDDAGGSQFGGARTLNGYEVGLALSWNVFDRGINRAEARRLNYLKRAKETEMRATPSLHQRKVDFARQRVEVAKRNLEHFEEQLASQRSILEVTERSYEEGGDKSYINMINAFLTYEALRREKIHGNFDYIQKQADLAAAESSWRPELIQSLDALFVAVSE